MTYRRRCRSSIGIVRMATSVTICILLATSRIIFRGPPGVLSISVAETPSSLSLISSSVLAFTQPELWSIRIASVAVTYVSFIAYTDRPRGMLSSDIIPSLKISESTVPGAGSGLFCDQTVIRRGTILGTYPGVVIPLQQHITKLRQYPQCEGYIWRFSDNQFVIDPTDKFGDIQNQCYGGNPSMPLSIALFSKVLAPFVSVPTTLCRINEPPKGRDVNVITEENLQSRTVTFILERDVYEGEEFFIDYGLSYDRSMYGCGTAAK